jgi:GR25 family glycosyltransferase involved in LPS biosynthesis
MGQFGANEGVVKAQSTYVVNLLRRTDRKEAVEVAMDAAGIKDNDYEFFEAVDGKDLVITDDIKTLFMGNDFGSRRGVIGCALSHYNLWKQLVADDTNEYYTIFEDDITLLDGFKEKWDSAKANIDITAPHFTSLGYTSRDTTIRTKVVKSKKAEYMDMATYIGGFFGYIITKVAAKKMCDYIASNGIKHGIDYIVKICDKLTPSEIRPQIVFSEWYEFADQTIDTDIQKDRNSIDFNIQINTDDENFSFFLKLKKVNFIINYSYLDKLKK